MKTSWILVAIPVAFALFTASAVLADTPKIKTLSAELEMKDFHATEFTPGPLEAGQPVTLTFKNNAVVRVTAVAIQENIVRLKAELLRSDGGDELYNSTFLTRYNSEAEIYEKKPDGDLIYRLKINPQVQEKK